MKYSTFLVADAKTPRGYRDRQNYANSQNAGLYVEFHFNAKEYDKPGVQDNPATVLVCNNAGTLTRKLAADFADHISRAFGHPNGGLLIRSPGDRAYYNLYYSRPPAILIEPLYVSDPTQAALAMREDTQQRIAEILRDVVVKYFPDGVSVACSLGHKFKPAPHHFDRGAPICKAVPNPKNLAEADLAEQVMEKFRTLLASAG